MKGCPHCSPHARLVDGPRPALLCRLWALPAPGVGRPALPSLPGQRASATPATQAAPQPRVADARPVPPALPLPGASRLGCAIVELLKTLRAIRTRGSEVIDVANAHGNGPAELAKLRAAIEAEVRAHLEREAGAKQREANASRQAGRRRRASKDGQGSGPLPYGYVRAKASMRTYEGDLLFERGDIVIDESTARIVRRIFALHRAGRSTEDIALHLAEVGTRTLRGGVWSESSVRVILAHEQLYRTGIRIWGGIRASELWPTILRS